MAYPLAHPQGERKVVVEPTHLKNMLVKLDQIPQVGVKIKSIWNHHLEKVFFGDDGMYCWNIVFSCWIKMQNLFIYSESWWWLQVISFVPFVIYRNNPYITWFHNSDKAYFKNLKFVYRNQKKNINEYYATLPETNSSPLKIGRAQKGKARLPPIHFRCKQLVPGRVTHFFSTLTIWVDVSPIKN